MVDSPSFPFFVFRFSQVMAKTLLTESQDCLHCHPECTRGTTGGLSPPLTTSESSLDEILLT